MAYKVKATAPKNYSIRPWSGSIRKGESTVLQIIRKPEEGAGPEEGAKKKKERFLVQAAAADTDEKKLLLFAADKGKAAGRTKFWEGVADETLQEQTLDIVLCDEPEPAPAPAEEVPGGAGVGRGTAERTPGKGSSRGSAPQTAGYGGSRPVAAGTAAGMPSDQTIDEIIGRLSKPKPKGQPGPAPTGAPGLGSEHSAPGLVAPGAPGLGAPSGYVPRPAAPPMQRAPVAREATAPGRQRFEDVVLQGHSRPVTFIAFDPGGKVLFTCGKDKLVLAWSCPGGECIRRYEGHRGAVWSCSLSSDGWLLSCGADGLVILWQAATSQQLHQVELPGVVRCVEWGNGLCPRFVCCNTGFKTSPASVTLWELGLEPAISSRCCLAIEVPRMPAPATQVTWAGDRICSVHDSGDVIFWSAGSGVQLIRLEAHAGPVSRVVATVDGQLLLTCGRTDMQVKVWCLVAPRPDDDDELDLNETLAPTLLRTFVSDRPLNSVAFRPNFSFADMAEGQGCVCLAGGGQDAREVALVGAGTDDQFEPLPLQISIVVQPQDSGLVLCPAEGPWDPKSRKGGGHFGPIHCLAFSPDALICASGSEDGNVRLRELPVPSA